MQYKEYPLQGVEAREFENVRLLDEAGFNEKGIAKGEKDFDKAGKVLAEAMEIKVDTFSITGFPLPDKRYHMSLQSDQMNLESIYFWLLNHVMSDFNLPYAIKVVDTTAASVSSSSFGDLQARLGAQQSQVSNYMATVGRMVKDMFNLVRELRTIRERLGYYYESGAESKDEQGKTKDKKVPDGVKDSAEKTLKGIWIDVVEGGSQNPSSVIGLAQRVGFTVLPDLFFSAPPMNEDGVHDYVHGDKKKNIPALDFNDQIKNMLERKLFQYYRWKKETFEELQTKKKFQLRYLRQHFDSIRMYLAWLKPYLRHIEMLNLDQNKMANDPLLVSSFQTQIMEIETLAYGNPEGKTKEANNIFAYHPVVLLHFHYRSQPSLDFHAKEAWQQKGPIHIGKVDVVMRVYSWRQKDIDAYVKMRQKADFSMLESIDNSLKDAMDALGEDLIKFLEEAGEKVPEDMLPSHMRKKEEKKDEKPGRRETIYDPFLAIGQGMLDVFKPIVPINWNFGESKAKKAAEDAEAANKKNKGSAMFKANLAAWNGYKNFKKAHGQYQW